MLKLSFFDHVDLTTVTFLTVSKVPMCAESILIPIYEFGINETRFRHSYLPNQRTAMVWSFTVVDQLN